MTERMLAERESQALASLGSLKRRAYQPKKPIGRPRLHPRAKVNDRFGARTVIALLPRDHTRNERVLVRCDSGHVGPQYVFNLYAHARCKRCPRKARAC